MKNFTRAALTGVGVSVFLSVSCTKNEVESPGLSKKNQAICDVAVFTQQYTNGEAGYVFNKSYDLSGRRISRIDVGLYSGGAIWTTVHLNLSYENNKVYFVSANNSSDTGLVVHIDNAGRALRAEAGPIIDDGFGPQEFFYENDRLHLINIDSNWMRIWFRYDKHGNNTQIVTDSADGMPRVHHEYQYKPGKKYTQQLYLDETRGFSFNVLTILHAAGFFPELNPVNTRVRSTVHWGPYLAYDYVQRDHVYDKAGRLLQYKTASSGSGSAVATYSINYNCANTTNDLITSAR